MVTTTNKGIEKPTYQQYALDPTGWTNPINTNWDIIDKAFGGTYTPPAFTSSSSDVTLTTTQCQNVRILLTGTATTSKTITVFFPATISGFFIIDNSTTGPFTFNIKVTGAGPSSEFIVAVQNANTLVWVDSTTTGVYLADNSPLTAGTGITVSGSTVSLTAPVTTTLGGTGKTSYTNGQLLIGNAAGGLTATTLTAGSNITITNGDGAITIGASGSAGGVTTFSGGSTGLTPSTASAGAVTLGGLLAIGSGGTGATTAANARTNLGLGTIATQASNSVSITGGSISGVSISGIASIGVSAGASANATTSKVSTNTNFTYIGQNSSSTNTFTVNGNGAVISKSITSGNGTTFTTATNKFNSSDDWAAEFKSTSVAGSVAVEAPNGGILMGWFNSGVNIANVINNGTSVSYNTTSDYRLKEQVVDFAGGMSAIRALRPVTFKWKSNPSGPTATGFIAHEVQAVIPQAISGEKDAVNADGSIKPQGMDNSFIVPYLVAAIKELESRIAALEAKP